jgi:hypothetical protein
MTPEEQLDRLIEARKRGALLRPAGEDVLNARLDAADALLHLREIEVPADFADELEVRLRQRIRSLNGSAQHLPFVPRPTSRETRAPRMMGRAWVTALTLVATLVLACVGAFSAAASSRPGDLFYGLKQAGQGVSLILATDPQGKTQVTLSHLQSAVADLSAEVNSGYSDDHVLQALAVVSAKTNESKAAVDALPAGPDRDAAQQALASALADEDQTLRQLLPKLDWPLRVAFTIQLGALGDGVPTITQVTVKHQSNSTFTVTITGSNFTPQTQVLLNSQLKGTITSQNSTQLVVLYYWAGERHSIGVLNPDGTAAQATLTTGDDEGGDDHGGTPNPTGTPGATGTPRHGGGGGGPGGSPTPGGTPDN